MVFEESDYLSLSGIQHFSFCRRQWALIHIEQQWQENVRTTEGEIIHEKAHEDSYEKRLDRLIVRGLPVFSRSLGIRGVCDVVEFHRDPNGIKIHTHDGLWTPVPIEYKRGKAKDGLEDILQLAAQILCLEEMLMCSIAEGYLYYAETRRRQSVPIDESLRKEVQTLLMEMHEIYRRRYTPKVKMTPKCKGCSLKDLCMPQLGKTKTVAEYIGQSLKDDNYA